MPVESAYACLPMWQAGQVRQPASRNATPAFADAIARLPFVLRAKQLEIEGLQRMAARIELVDLIGRLIDALQRERGASSLYVASGGMRFGRERQDATAQAEPLEATLRQRFMEQLDPAGAALRACCR